VKPLTLTWCVYLLRSFRWYSLCLPVRDGHDECVAGSAYRQFTHPNTHPTVRACHMQLVDHDQSAIQLGHTKLLLYACKLN